MTKKSIPMIVSKRNHFRPADELVENGLVHLPDQFKHPDFRAWLLRYTETVIKDVASHFGLAASRGIEQAAELLCDPEFYETRRQRRAKYHREFREQMAKQEWERVQLQNCPTAEQIQDQARWAEGKIKYHEQQATAYQQKLAHLKTLVPSIHIEPTSVQ